MGFVNDKGESRKASIAARSYLPSSGLGTRPNSVMGGGTDRGRSPPANVEPFSDMPSDISDPMLSDLDNDTALTASARSSTALCLGISGACGLGAAALGAGAGSGALGAGAGAGAGFGASGTLRKISDKDGFAGAAGLGVSVILGASTTGAGAGLGATGIGGGAGFAAIAAKLIGAGTAGAGAAGFGATGATTTAAAGGAGAGAATAGAAGAAAGAAGAAVGVGVVGSAGFAICTSCFVLGLTILIALLATLTGVAAPPPCGGVDGGFAYAGMPIGGIPAIGCIIPG